MCIHYGELHMPKICRKIFKKSCVQHLLWNAQWAFPKHVFEKNNISKLINSSCKKTRSYCHPHIQLRHVLVQKASLSFPVRKKQQLLPSCRTPWEFNGKHSSLLKRRTMKTNTGSNQGHQFLVFTFLRLVFYWQSSPNMPPVLTEKPDAATTDVPDSKQDPKSYLLSLELH